MHAARPDDPPFQRRTIRRANPSYDHLPSLQRQLAAEVEAARRDPDALASWRALRLNGGTDDTEVSVLVDADTWADLTGGAPAIGRYVLGLDLGQNAAMSAAAAYWPAGRLEALAVFPEVPPLAERGLSDGVGDLYRRMAERGELLQAGRRVSDVRALLGEVLSRWGRPAVIVADRWREAELRQALESVRFPLADLSVRGQGFKDGGEDVRRFRRADAGWPRPPRGEPAAHVGVGGGPRGRRSGRKLEIVARQRRADGACGPGTTRRLRRSSRSRRAPGGGTPNPRWRHVDAAPR